MIRYVGTVAGLRDFAQPALRRCGMRGYTIKDNARQIQNELNKAALKDLARRRKGGRKCQK